MGKRLKYILGGVVLSISMSITVLAEIPAYLTESEYNDMLYDNYIEERGIVVENYPELGYLVYRNSQGKKITCNYYKDEIVVEKEPYYEIEDKIGYIDEMFPNFEYDPRDSSIASIQAGDSIYIRLNKDGVATYISAYNDYLVRYGKVISFQYNTGEVASLQIQDEKGNIYVYDVNLNTPVTKGSTASALSTIKTGSWVKVLVCQKILGEGIIDETVQEIVIDNDTRYISNIYRGQVTSVDTFKKMLNLKNTQTLGKTNWGAYNSLLRIGLDTTNVSAYLIGNRVSLDYVSRNLKNADGYVYVAAENYKGKENAIKLNFQSKLQTTLEPSLVTYASANTVKLLSGETIYIAEDAIIVRDKRLVDGNSIMVGDTLQAVVTGENKLAVGNIMSEKTTGSLEVFRGRIKQIKERESFQFETFSLLQDNTWYYHPTPHTFSIDANTKFYTSEGIVEDGIEAFLDYGDQSEVRNVYTVVAIGEKAYMIIDMPYTTESVKGQVYKTADGSIQIKDVYYYHNQQKKWVQYSKKNVGATINLQSNTVILKDGKVIPARSLEEGDIISAMVETNLKDSEGNVNGYIIIVEN